MIKYIVACLVLIIAVIIGFTKIRPHQHAIEQFNIKEEQEPISQGELNVQFLGNTNLLISDGHHRILTDGFFTRPSAFKILFGNIEPHTERIKWCLSKAGISYLDAVIPLHSHFDHAMDAPMVADLTNAKLIGSTSTANIGRGYGLPEHQMIVPKPNETIQIGKFKIQFIPSAHWQYPSAKQRKLLLNQEISVPLKPPVKMSDYKEGTTYTLIIEHDSITLGIQGSAGFKEGSIIKSDVDILFLAIAGLETMDENYNDQYQQLLIDALKPEILIPIHFDDFTVPLKRGLKSTSLLFDLKFNTDLQKAFDIILDNNKQREIYTLPLWEKYSIKRLVEKHSANQAF